MSVSLYPLALFGFTSRLFMESVAFLLVILGLINLGGFIKK
ncbi:PF07220 domain protein [Leptospira interrogans serovar Australis str. 200703203]|uniref:PF07220 domain protein n=1 Tax=Leptospira interrogans serovar Australis str. 200703203 TaxID=1085541 RepID=N1UFR6_LEPIR|nr:PF07220 domain protein [Leptospira interrogans serovar Australis str. 200703203]